MKLRDLLKRAGVSAEQLSKKIGMPGRTLSHHWTTGRIPYPIIYKIHKVTGLSIEEIVPEYLAMYWEALFDEQTSTNLPRGKSKLKEKEDISKDIPEFWFTLAKWAKDHDRLSPFGRNFAFNMGILLSRKKTPSPKQVKIALRIRKQSMEEGYNESFIVPMTI